MESLKSGQVADRLGVSKPTVRSLIARRELDGRREKHGQRFHWLVDVAEVERYAAANGSLGRTMRAPSRLDRIELKLDSLLETVSQASSPASATASLLAIERERDDLRADVIRLREALARSRTVSALQREADDERAAAINHLLAAAAAGERADALRRLAVTEFEDAVAAFSRPGHPGQM